MTALFVFAILATAAAAMLAGSAESRVVQFGGWCIVALGIVTATLALARLTS